MNLFFFGKTGRIALLVAALAVLLASAAASWWSIDNLVDRDALVAHTHEVLAELRLLPPALARANEDRLAIHAAPPQAVLLSPQQALTSARESLARLEQLTSDNERQQQRLTRLRTLFEEHFREDAPAGMGKHDAWLAGTKHLLEEMAAEEQGLLRDRDRQARASSRLAMGTQALTTLLALGVLGGIVWLARRDMRNRLQVEGRIRLLNAELEQRVLERTRELLAAKDAAESSQRRTRLIVDGAHDSYVAINADGRIIDWNHQAEQALGWPRELVVGKPLHEILIPTRFREAHVRGLRHFLTTGEGPLLQKRIEIHALHRDGHEFPVEMTISPLRLGDDWIFSAFLHDIGERKRAEEELRHAKEVAEDASRAKSEFLANMSHEIRTPLNGVLGMAEVVLDTNLTAEQREYIVTMQSSAQALLTILNDILDFSKIEAGKLDLAPEPIFLRDCLADTLKPLAVRACKKEVELAFRVAADVPNAVIADWGRLQQILINLIGNAIKFTERGEVVVNVQLASERPADAGRSPSCVLHFSVRDTGIGIPANKLGTIFAPFEQADGSTARKFGGTGLGLAISGQLVALMGGRVWVESEVGRGSTFHFTVQLARSAQPCAPSYRGLQRIPVLVVDDSAISRSILAEMLDSWGMRPALAATTAQAREVLEDAARRGQPFDVLLLDAELPVKEIDSLVCQASLPEGRNAILLLPSAAYRGDGEEWASLQAFSRVAKPIKPSDLLECIQQSIEGRAAGTPRRSDPAGDTTESSLPPLRILMAEDNPVNQRLGVLLLEKQGHTVVLANNGREALAALSSASFDLVLMDVQMPEMDGLETTAALRRHEEGTGRRTPIVALTAHAMKGDRERCLAAGMDGYISKPIQARELFRVLREVRSAEQALAPTRHTLAPLDGAAILERLGGDTAVLREIAALFRQDAARLLGEIDNALARGDIRLVQRSAHSLKGSAGFFGSVELIETATELEKLERADDLTAGRDILERLSPHVEALCSALESLAKN